MLPGYCDTVGELVDCSVIVTLATKLLPLRRRALLAVLEHVHFEGVEDRDEAVDERPDLAPLLGGCEVAEHELLDRGAVGLRKSENVYAEIG